MAECAFDWSLAFAGTKTVLDPLAAASWPIAIAWACYFFRLDIQKLIDRVRLIRGVGLEADLQGEVQQLANERTPRIGNGDPGEDQVYSPMDASVREYLDKEIGDDLEKKLAWAIRLRSMSETARVNETIYRLIFGSQLSALQHLNQSGGVASVESVERFYQEAKEDPQWSAIYENRPFSDWLHFLYQANLVTNLAPEKLALTAMGKNFLVWTAQAGVPLSVRAA